MGRINEKIENIVYDIVMDSVTLCGKVPGIITTNYGKFKLVSCENSEIFGGVTTVFECIETKEKGLCGYKFSICFSGKANFNFKLNKKC